MFALLFRRNPGSAPPRSRFSLRHHSGRPVIPFAHLVIVASSEQPTNVEKSYTCAGQDTDEEEGSHAKRPRREERIAFGSGDCPAGLLVRSNQNPCPELSVYPDREPQSPSMPRPMATELHDRVWPIAPRVAQKRISGLGPAGQSPLPNAVGI